jgi:putative NADPH-quinone reductase
MLLKCPIGRAGGDLPKPLVILGSARRSGETRRAVDIAFPAGSIDLATLCDHQISGYDYTHLNADDDFQFVVDLMLAANTIVIATPVYWYAMSGLMKMFFDRLTDLLETSKEKGRMMAGKELWMIASGTERILPEGFEVPVARTAQYFNIGYRGAEYLYTGDNPEIRQHSEAALANFGQRVLASH